MRRTDSVIEDFYNYLADGDSKKLEKIHIPKSDVFYIRAAVESRTGIRYSLEHIEKILKEEGYLNES